MTTARFWLAVTRRSTSRRQSGRVALALTLILAVGSVAPLGSVQIAGVAAQETDGGARVAHSTDGVNLRATPAYGAEIVLTIAAGTAIDLRTADVDTVYDPDGDTRWWPVSVYGVDGWIAGVYLDIDGGETPETPAVDLVSADTAEASAAEPETVTSGSDLMGGTSAIVTSADGVNLRETPGASGASIASLKDGAVVDLRITEVDTVWADGGRWWPVAVDGQRGWIAGSYLAPDAGSRAASESASSTSADPGFGAGAYVSAATESRGGVNMRADPAADAEEVGFIPEGDVVQVMDGPFWDPSGSAWYLITDGEVSGYADAALLAIADQPAAPDDEASAEPAANEVAAADQARVPRSGTATGSLIPPVGGATLTQGYGCSIYWFEPYEAAYGCNFHNGIDLADPAYTPLVAADGGVVEYAGWCDCGLGFYVKIDHGNGFKTVYGHMAEQPWVGAGQAVAQGEVIGPLGSSGNSTGPHVHFIVELNGSTVDPAGYVGV